MYESDQLTGAQMRTRALGLGMTVACKSGGMGFERGTDGPRVIVAAVDASTTSMRAAAYAAGLARRQSAELVVVFVAAGSAMANLIPAAGSEVDSALHDLAEDLREQVT